MRRLWLLIILMMATMALSSGLLQLHSHPFPNENSSIESVDSMQPDTIHYDTNPNQPLLYSGNNYWSAQRFSPTGSFRLHSVYFKLPNVSSTATPCSVFVYYDTLNGTTHRPGSQISTMLIRIAPDSISTSLQWIDRDFPDSTLFNAGQDFWIVYGPAPGGTSGGYWSAIDNGPTTDGRAIINVGSRTDWTAPFVVPYHLVVRAGGVYSGTILNIGVDSLWSTDTQANHFFFHPFGTPVTYSAKVRNYGNHIIPSYNLDFAVVDTANAASDTIFHQVFLNRPALAIGASANTTTSYDTLPNANANLIVTARAFLASDGDTANNVQMLEQKVNNLGVWYSYSDNTADANIGYTPGWAVGCSFIPSRYPATIDSVTLHMSNTAAFHTDTLYFVTQANLNQLPTSFSYMKTFDIGTTTPNLDSLVQVRIDTPITISSGAIWVMWKASTSQSIWSDATPPIAGSNTEMVPTSFHWNGGGFVRDTSGDWQIAVHIISSIPPYPVLRTRPAVNDTVRFDTTSIGSNSVRPLVFFNDGGQTLSVTSLVVPPIGTVQVVNNDTVFTVAPGDSHSVGIRWSPNSQTTLDNLLSINSNDNANSVSYIELFGFVRSASVPDNKALPHSFALFSNVPNPFNPSTTIRFAVPTPSLVKITVVDIMGRNVSTLVNSRMTAGFHTVSFNGNRFASGVYFYRMEAGTFESMRKMILIK